jgi:hypothetical protein
LMKTESIPAIRLVDLVAKKCIIPRKSPTRTGEASPRASKCVIKNTVKVANVSMKIRQCFRDHHLDWNLTAGRDPESFPCTIEKGTHMDIIP